MVRLCPSLDKDGREPSFDHESTSSAKDAKTLSNDSDLRRDDADTGDRSSQMSSVL
jgi:hypothetical protein